MRIGEGRREVFLVCDKSLKRNDAPFLNMLHAEGFSLGDHHGNFGCPWVFVDITRKKYAYGMPGVALAGVIGNHAITIDEFMAFYTIYKKYEDKELFVFNAEPFDCS